MKVALRPPSSLEIAQELAQDPLRRPREKIRHTRMTPRLFTSKLSRILLWSRFEPRLLSTAVERLALFPEKIDVERVRDDMKKSPWPELWPLALRWAAEASDNARLDDLAAMTRALVPPERLRRSAELYFINLHRPGSARTERLHLTTPKIWREFGYLASDAPYSKELLAWAKKVPPVSLPTWGVKLVVREFLAEHRGWVSLADIERNCRTGLSQRQLQRIVSSLKGIRTTGELKGMRYRLAMPLASGPRDS